jgi:hypothetical protein
MQTATANDIIAINSVTRVITYFATFASLGGGPIVVSDYETNRELKDVPDQINLFGGVASGQCILHISSANAAALSPYNTPSSVFDTVQSAKLKSAVSVGVKIVNKAGVGDTTFTLFTGLVSRVKFSPNGSAEITCLDRASLLIGKFNLVPAGNMNIVNQGAPQSPDLSYSPLAIVDQAMRSAGIYFSPKPLLVNDPLARAKYCILSVSGFGGPLPDVGYLQGQFSSAWERSAGAFTPDVLAKSNNNFMYGNVDFSLYNGGDIKLLAAEGWFLPSSQMSTGDSTFLCVFPWIIIIYADGTSQITGQGDTPATFTGPTFNTSGWNYFRLETSIVNGLLTQKVTFNGMTITADNAAAGLTVFTSNMVINWTQFGDDSFPLGLESLEMHYLPPGSTYTLPAWRYGATAPEVSSGITPTDIRMAAIAQQTGLDAWPTVQLIAQAEGALAYFDELGHFRFEPRAIFQNRKTGTSQATFSYFDRLQALEMSFDDSGLYGSVTANVQPLNVTQDKGPTGGQWTFQSADTLTAPPGHSVQYVASNTKFITPLFATDFAVNVAPASALMGVYSVIQNSRQTDPAAPYLTNVRVRCYPTTDGFQLVVDNPNSFVIGFYTKGFAASGSLAAVAAGPYFWIAGYAIRPGSVVAVTQGANPNLSTNLTLTDNSYRGDLLGTQQLVAGVAADVTAPIALFDNVICNGDPRMQLGDMISVLPNKIAQTPIPCLIVGCNQLGQPENAYDMHLNLRPLGQPIGWLLGIPGRSELGSTAVFVAPY